MPHRSGGWSAGVQVKGWLPSVSTMSQGSCTWYSMAGSKATAEAAYPLVGEVWSWLLMQHSFLSHCHGIHSPVQTQGGDKGHMCQQLPSTTVQRLCSAQGSWDRHGCGGGGLMGTVGALVWLSREKSGSDCQFVRGTTDQNHLPWPGTTVISCMSYLTTGSSGKEHGTNKLPPTGRIWERSKEERRYQFICLTYEVLLTPRILLAGTHLG